MVCFVMCSVSMQYDKRFMQHYPVPNPLLSTVIFISAGNDVNAAATV